MKKIAVFILIAIIALSFASCDENPVLEEIQTYDVIGEIHSLDIRINAADFVIVAAEGFSVESNLKYLSVSEKNGVLSIIDKANFATNYGGAELTITVPENTAFDDVSISVGAAKLVSTAISADTVKLNLGAGDVSFSCLNAASSIEIGGGAGEITVADGVLNNLVLDMGVGEFNLTAALLGECDLKFGVGQSDLILLGGKDSYTVDIEKGVGNITLDGVDVTDFDNGDGENHIKIEGGIGTINIEFRN